MTFGTCGSFWARREQSANQRIQNRIKCGHVDGFDGAAVYGGRDRGIDREGGDGLDTVLGGEIRTVGREDW